MFENSVRYNINLEKHQTSNKFSSAHKKNHWFQNFCFTLCFCVYYSFSQKYEFNTQRCDVSKKDGMKKSTEITFNAYWFHFFNLQEFD